MLGDLLTVPALDPMTPEVVAVPTRGIERWLTQQLSSRLGATPGREDGVCANVDFPFPGTLVGTALSAASGIDPGEDPWTASRSVWPLLEVVTGAIEEKWLGSFAAHLKGAAPVGEERRFASVRHMADLFDRYSVHRPEMLRQWAAGETGGLASDGSWQATLWTSLRERIGTPSPAERLTEAGEWLRDVHDVPALPERLSLFGLTSLPASYVDVLVALSARRDVHLFLLHPSPVLWEQVSKLASAPFRAMRRREDPTTSETRNGLLASWGRDSREMQLVLLGAGASWVDHHRSVATGPTTLLERVQADVRANEEPVGIPFAGEEDHRPLLSEGDLSIQVHSCHGRARQVEVIRHAILHLFELHPDLEPRDVLVMCPDIETYAPLIHAAFDALPDDQSDSGHPDLRVRLADRAIRQINPLFGVVTRLLSMAGGRVTATEILDLAGCEPVRRHFGFDDEDLARLEEWVVASGIRWGLDSDHRVSFQLGGLSANTWEAGLNRILVGVSMAEQRQRLFGGVLPLDDVGSGDIELAGKFAELIDRVDTASGELCGSQTVERWAESIASCVEALASTSVGDEWQSVQLARLLADLVDEATTDGLISPVHLGLGDIRSILGDRLRGRPSRANFRTGHLTVCTLVPMRSVPHRVVCLLGLDDGAFPRNPERDGDDLILADPHIGDHDARSEDRQLVLDALLAAKDHLVITYTGRDERSNLARPPAVPVGELLDVIDRTVRTSDGEAPRRRVVISHPLQPFDARNFMPGKLLAAGPWSFDKANLEGARAAAAREGNPESALFLPGPLGPIDETLVDLRNLEMFLRFPVNAFLRLRLGVNLSDRASDVEDSLPVELDSLQKWGFADRVLTELLAGGDLEACIAAERARGLLPPGSLSDSLIDQVVPDLEALVAVGSDDRSPTSVSVNVVLPSGTTVVGTVPSIRGDAIHTVTYSKMSPSLRIVGWLRLLALTAALPDRRFEAVTVARGQDGAGGPSVSVARLSGLGSDSSEGRDASPARFDAATRHLETIVDLYFRSMREAPPLYCKTSAAWAEAASRQSSSPRAAEAEWTSRYATHGEDKRLEHILVLGGVAPFGQITDSRPRQDEMGAGWDESESTRVGRWARRLWDGVLAHEKVGAR
jgi:exodeoxyribonuclease V gamma subunit